MSDQAPIAEFSDYDGMLQALRARAEQRKVATTSEAIADVSGLPDKYMQKLIGSKPVRRIGMISLGPILGVLGVKLVMVEDPAALARFAAEVPERNESKMHAVAMHITLTRRFMRKIGALGGHARKKNLSKREARKIARKAALARWGKIKREIRRQAADVQSAAHDRRSSRSTAPADVRRARAPQREPALHKPSRVPES
jgi:hypothetical protein